MSRSSQRRVVTGVGGLVGGALARALVASGSEVHGTVRTRPAPDGVSAEAVELSEPGAFAALVERVRPDVVVHAAYSMRDLDRDVVDATEQVATACGKAGVPLVHISTDAVFDGEHAPYDERDVPEPVHPYGAAKRRAELIVEEHCPDAAIARTALVAHLDDVRPDTATQWVLDAQERGEPVTLFTDEVRSVVRLDDLVAALIQIVALGLPERSGAWHVGGPERLSRWQLGEILVERYDLDPSLIVPGLASEMPGPRPRDVSLTCDRMLRELSIRPRPVATVRPHGPATG